MMNNFVQGNINSAESSKNNKHIVKGNNVNDKDFTVYALKYLIDNDIFQIEHLRVGFEYGNVNNYESFDNYYKFVLYPNEQTSLNSTQATI